MPPRRPKLQRRQVPAPPAPSQAAAGPPPGDRSFAELLRAILGPDAPEATITRLADLSEVFARGSGKTNTVGAILARELGEAFGVRLPGVGTPLDRG